MCRGALTEIVPDAGDSDFLKITNSVIDISQDEAQAFVDIPWDRQRWTKRATNETVGDQWERLMTWDVHLDLALARLEEISSHTQQDTQLTHWQEMEEAEAAGRDYFAELAATKRKDVIRMEKKVQSLREEYERLYQEIVAKQKGAE